MADEIGIIPLHEPEKIRGNVILASYTLIPCAGCVAARILLIEVQHFGKVTEYVTAQHNLGDGSWYWGHYFENYREARADFIERIKEH